MAFRGDRLREHREALKAESKGKKGSQSWLAYEVGAHVTSISDWERGRNEPSSRYIKKLAAALGVSTDRLLEDEEAASAPIARDLAAMFEMALERVFDAKFAERDRERVA